MKKLIIIIVIILMTVVMISAQAHFTISPPKYEIFVKEQDEKTFIIYVENLGDTVTHIKVTPSDWDLDIDNNVQFFPPKTFENSCSDWFYINPLEFNLNPGTVEEVRVTMVVPKNVFGEYRSLLFFESTPFSPEANSMLLFSSRVGCTIYVDILGTVSLNGEIVSMKYDFKDDNVLIGYSNTGNMHQRLDIIVKISRSGNDIYSYKLEEQLVLPNRERMFEIPVETRLSDGQYKIKVSIDYGGSEILIGEKLLKIGK
ncbi:hypothetical protein KAU15_04670 [candidate division WOR-3 bacterium]|nr:hypothetical protein [candidate division WOR-3 bacterium]